jgi:hypothetical protein
VVGESGSRWHLGVLSEGGERDEILSELVGRWVLLKDSVAMISTMWGSEKGGESGSEKECLC